MRLRSVVQPAMDGRDNRNGRTENSARSVPNSDAHEIKSGKILHTGGRGVWPEAHLFCLAIAGGWGISLKWPAGKRPESMPVQNEP